MHDDFEAQLRAALSRQEPSPGFAERVIAQAQPRRAPSRLWALAVAAVLVAGIFVYRDVQQRRAEAAREQTLAALRITVEKLNRVQAKLASRQGAAERENP